MVEMKVKWGSMVVPSATAAYNIQDNSSQAPPAALTGLATTLTVLHALGIC